MDVAQEEKCETVIFFSSFLFLRTVLCHLKVFFAFSGPHARPLEDGAFHSAAALNLHRRLPT